MELSQCLSKAHLLPVVLFTVTVAQPASIHLPIFFSWVIPDSSQACHHDIYSTPTWVLLGVKAFIPMHVEVEFNIQNQYCSQVVVLLKAFDRHARSGPIRVSFGPPSPVWFYSERLIIHWQNHYTRILTDMHIIVQFMQVLVAGYAACRPYPPYYRLRKTSLTY
jgi:hypothetical protein